MFIQTISNMTAQFTANGKTGTITMSRDEKGYIDVTVFHDDCDGEPNECFTDCQSAQDFVKREIAKIGK